MAPARRAPPLRVWSSRKVFWRAPSLSGRADHCRTTAFNCGISACASSRKMANNSGSRASFPSVLVVDAGGASIRTDPAGRVGDTGSSGPEVPSSPPVVFAEEPAASGSTSAAWRTGSVRAMDKDGFSAVFFSAPGNKPCPCSRADDAWEALAVCGGALSTMAASFPSKAMSAGRCRPAANWCNPWRTVSAACSRMSASPGWGVRRAIWSSACSMPRAIDANPPMPTVAELPAREWARWPQDSGMGARLSSAHSPSSCTSWRDQVSASLR